MRLGGAGELVGGFPEPKAAQHGLGAHADVAMKEALQGSLGAAHAESALLRSSAADGARAPLPKPPALFRPAE